MALTFKNSVIGAASGGSNPYTVSGLTASASGDLVVVLVATGNAQTVSSITDNQSQSYTRAVTQNNGSGNGGSEIWYKYNSAAGVTSVTITVSGFTNTWAAVCTVSGALTASDPLDLTASAVSAFTGATTWTSGNSAGSAAQADEIFFGVAQESGGQSGSTFSPGSGYTGIGGDSSKNFYSEYKILSTASGQYAADGGLSPNSGCVYEVCMASFKAAAGGGTTYSNSVTLANSLSVSDSNTLVAANSISLAEAIALALTNNAVLVASASLGYSPAITVSLNGNVYSVSISPALGLTFTPVSGLIANNALSLAYSPNILVLSTAILNSSLTLSEAIAMSVAGAVPLPAFVVRGAIRAERWSSSLAASKTLSGEVSSTITLTGSLSRE